MCETFAPCNVVEHLGHFDGIVPSLACILTKQHGVHGGKYLLKTPGNTISETLNFKISLNASALKNLCLWCKFQNCLLFINSLPLKKFLTALRNLCAVDENYSIIFNIAKRFSNAVLFGVQTIWLVEFIALIKW